MIPLPCPTCGSELALLEQYQRYYCHSCGRYAPEGYGDRGAKICPTCRGILSYVPQYDRYYCFRCSAYPDEEAVLESLETKGSPAFATQSVTEPAVTESAKAEESGATTVAMTAGLSPQPAQRAEEEIPLEEQEPPKARRPLDRDEIARAKKPLLMDLCKAYNLDPTGTKEALRERLLSYLDTLEQQAKREEAPVETLEPEESGPSEPVAAVEEQPPAERPTSERATATQDAMEPLESDTESPPSTAAQLTEVVETAATPGSAVVTVSAPVVEASAPSMAASPESYAVETTRSSHPCPTCGRELTYIALYRRWYCYHCRAYAPTSTSKYACPNCGATLRWIEQYERWWCDACRRYAPADLPRPDTSVAAATVAVVAQPISQAATFPTTFVHRHRSPGGAIGLMGFGIVLFVLYELLVDLPGILSINLGIIVDPDVAFGLRFFAFVFVAVGAIMGLSAVRDRR